MELQELAKILVCPIDKQPVRLEDDWIICTSCDAHYPIENGIPYMLAEEAKYPNGKRQSSQPAGEQH
ncbi:MAG: Trm112 family protein [Chloroflexi bacterium]|nr:Trm112 family protein [Chloroflexota bacterium]